MTPGGGTSSFAGSATSYEWNRQIGKNDEGLPRRVWRLDETS